MENKVSATDKIKKFFFQLADKLDKKLEEKAKSGNCACKQNEKENRSCCS